MKVLWLDTETTGLDPEKNGLIEVAMLVEIDGKIKADYTVNSGLFEDQEISEGAAQLQGLSVDEFAKKINEYQPPALAYKELKWLFNSWIDKYDKADRFMVAGYNVSFDIYFLEAFFRKAGDPYLHSYLGQVVDILPVCRYLSWAGIWNVSNHKLETVCNEMGIELSAHKALDDAKATRELALRIKSLIGGNLT